MEFPEKYIKRGKFKLHSGGITNIFYDVNGLLTNNNHMASIYDDIPCCWGTYVGIATGGAIIASQFLNWAMIKDGELKGKIEDDYYLIDDVCTTESSIKEAIKIIGKNPTGIFVVLDRRKKKTIKIESLYEV